VGQGSPHAAAEQARCPITHERGARRRRRSAVSRPGSICRTWSEVPIWVPPSRGATWCSFRPGSAPWPCGPPIWPDRRRSTSGWAGSCRRPPPGPRRSPARRSRRRQRPAPALRRLLIATPPARHRQERRRPGPVPITVIPTRSSDWGRAGRRRRGRRPGRRPSPAVPRRPPASHRRSGRRSCSARRRRPDRSDSSAAA
jgi:hypothetical protein